MAAAHRPNLRLTDARFPAQHGEPVFSLPGFVEQGLEDRHFGVPADDSLRYFRHASPRAEHTPEFAVSGTNQGATPMSGGPFSPNITLMPRFLLHHRHQARECPAAFAAWKGFESPLRHRATIGSCLAGGHEIWWELEAPSDAAALGQLPHFVAKRTEVTRVWDVQVP